MNQNREKDLFLLVLSLTMKTNIKDIETRDDEYDHAMICNLFLFSCSR
jgi:hypothetical protein